MATLLALISSVLWGSADFEGGRLSKKHAPIAVLGASQIFGLLFGIFLVITTGAWHVNFFGVGGFFLPGVAAGIFGYLGLICLYEGLSTGRMGVVSPISALGVVIPLSYALIKGDSLSLVASIGVCLAVVGAFCASGPEFTEGLPLKPLLLAIGAAFGFGTTLIFMSIGSQSSALMTMTTMRVATVFITLGIALRFKSYGNFTKLDLPSLVFIGIADFVANLLLGMAFNLGLVSLAMVLGSLYPIVTALLAFKVLHERLHKVQYVGIFLAVTGVALISAS